MAELSIERAPIAHCGGNADVSSPAHDAVIPRPIVRHNVADLFFDEVTRDHVQVSSYFTS